MVNTQLTKAIQGTNSIHNTVNNNKCINNKADLLWYNCLHLYLVASSLFHPITSTKPIKKLRKSIFIS